MKTEAMNMAVIMELPLVVLDVQRGGPATGLPTKSEQTDLLQVLFGRNGESPMPVLAATSPTDCFECAYMASKIALEHMTPVVLLTDAFVANGSAAWKLPKLADYPAIVPPYVRPEMQGSWTPYQRDATSARKRPAAAIGPSPEQRASPTSSADWRKTTRQAPSLPTLRTTT